MTEILQGDCVEVMAGMPEASVDAVVTDPPYGLEFMGKDWDRLAPDVPQWARDRLAGIDGGGEKGEKLKGKGNYLISKAQFPEHLVPRLLNLMQLWHERWAREAYRVLKPGGHLLAFGGSRTYHRMACAVEDAGFEIRDQIMWLYGSGFPKSLDVGKAMDKRGGVIPWQADFAAHLKQIKPKSMTYDEINAHVANGSKSNFWSHFTSTTSQPLLPTVEQYRRLKALLPIAPEWDQWFLPEAEREVVGANSRKAGWFTAQDGHDITAPATDLARQWHGWGTALKPAHEPIVVARKPLIGTVAANVEKHGTGALNVDGCRVGTGLRPKRVSHSGDRPSGIYQDGTFGSHADGATNQGRWPANVILDESAGAMLDGQSGERRSSGLYDPRGTGERTGGIATDFGGRDRPASMFSDTGGASRFFYCPKASRKEREAGLGALPVERVQTASNDAECMRNGAPRFTKMAANHHPTVKPIALMRYLVRLVTPPGGVVLDPFLGSGTTALACIEEGFDCIGIEREEEYIEIAKARVKHWQKKPRQAELPMAAQAAA